MSRPFRSPLWRIYQGQTLDDAVVWKAGKPPAPVDITGCAARLQVREDVDAPQVLLELTTASGALVVDGPAGTIRRRLSAEQTAALAWSDGVWDLEIVWPDGVVRRLAQGKVRVDREVTR